MDNIAPPGLPVLPRLDAKRLKDGDSPRPAQPQATGQPLRGMPARTVSGGESLIADTYRAPPDDAPSNNNEQGAEGMPVDQVPVNQGSMEEGSVESADLDMESIYSKTSCVKLAGAAALSTGGGTLLGGGIGYGAGFATGQLALGVTFGLLGGAVAGASIGLCLAVAVMTKKLWMTP